MMAHARKRMLALFMAFVMCVSLLPVSVLAQQYDLTLGAGDYTPEELIGIIDAAAQDGSLDEKDTEKWNSLSPDERRRAPGASSRMRRRAGSR